MAVGYSKIPKMFSAIRAEAPVIFSAVCESHHIAQRIKKIDDNKLHIFSCQRALFFPLLKAGFRPFSGGRPPLSLPGFGKESRGRIKNLLNKEGSVNGFQEVFLRFFCPPFLAVFSGFGFSRAPFQGCRAGESGRRAASGFAAVFLRVWAINWGKIQRETSSKAPHIFMLMALGFSTAALIFLR